MNGLIQGLAMQPRSHVRQRAGREKQLGPQPKLGAAGSDASVHWLRAHRWTLSPQQDMKSRVMSA
jgi:hypothetical protein